MRPGDRRDQLTGQLVDRMADLGIKTWAELGRQAKVSSETIRALRNPGKRGAHTLRPVTAAAIERVLKLQRGTLARFLAGDIETLELADDRPLIVRENWHDPMVQFIWGAPEGIATPAAKEGMVATYVRQFQPADQAALRAG
jgi:hypothetical protein